MKTKLISSIWMLVGALSFCLFSIAGCQNGNDSGDGDSDLPVDDDDDAPSDGDDADDSAPIADDDVDDDNADDSHDDDGNTVISPYTEDGSTVLYVDPSRYLGKWYEVATYPIFFQRNCTGSTAEYGFIDEATISVINTCRLGSLDGQEYQVVGSAIIVDPVTNARLRVGFDPLPIRVAPYWVIELDGADGEAEYQWAVVGGPTKDFLWILSRTPQIDSERMMVILDRLTERGYQVDKLSFTQQPEN